MSASKESVDTSTVTIDELLRMASHLRGTVRKLRDVYAALGQEILNSETQAAQWEAEAARRSHLVMEQRAAERVASEAHPYSPPKVDATSADGAGCGEGNHMQAGAFA